MLIYSKERDETMVTVAQALEMKAFTPGKVVAGGSGLNKRIEWIHQGDIPDIAEWCQPGELLFTSGFGLMDNPNLQNNLVAQLDERGVVGLVVSLGPYLPSIPDVMVDSANQLNFPLITLPWEVATIEVVRSLAEFTVQSHYQLMQQSLEIHNSLTQIVLQGLGIDALAQALARLTQCSVTIEDPYFRLLAYASWGKIDPVRLDTIQQLKTPASIIDELKRLGLEHKIQSSRTPIRLPAIPEKGLLFERILAPIVAGDTVYGYAWLIIGDRPISDLDTIAIEHAATVAALILLKDRAVHEAEQRQKLSVLEELLGSGPDISPGLNERAKRFFSILKEGIQVVLIRHSGGDVTSIPSLWLEREVIKLDPHALIVERAGDVVVILDSRRSEQGVRFARQLCFEGNNQGYSFTMGVGRAYQEWVHFSASFQEGQESLDTGIVIASGCVTTFEELGVWHWLHHLPLDIRTTNRYQAMISKLADHDAQRGSELLKTLESYLDFGLNVKETARRLSLHRNTLHQRLNKIENLLEIDFQQPLTYLNLHIAIKDMRLNTSKD